MASDSETRCIEICVETDREAAEAVCALLSTYGDSAPVMEQVWEAADAPVIRVKTYLSAADSDQVPRIEEALWHLSQIHPISEPSVRWLSEADWLEAWRAGYTLQRIGRRVVIKPSWETHVARADEIVVELDPGQAFGTGLHPSTRLCLTALEDWVEAGDSVLDAGTGSGILAIAAAKLGAGRVLGIDIDEVALRVAEANVRANGVQDAVRLRQASLLDLGTGPASGVEVPGSRSHVVEAGGCFAGLRRLAMTERCFTLVVMNILAKVIAESAQALADCLCAGAAFIVSGIMVPQKDLVLEALAEAGLRTHEQRIDGDWIALIGRKEGRQGGKR